MSFSMKSPQIAGLAALLLIASTPAALASPSEIHCRGEFQNVEGQWISTPYCQASNLASFARDHGMEVSARQIRKNPEKRAMCVDLSAKTIESLTTATQIPVH
jgi:hypothetical protein